MTYQYSREDITRAMIQTWYLVVVVEEIFACVGIIATHLVLIIDKAQEKAQEEAQRKEIVRQVLYGVDGNGDKIKYPEDGEEK